jgi:hypothetical protein
MLSLLGYYKPARNSARSAIENVIRSCLFLRKVEADKILSTYELFATAKSTFGAEPQMAKLISQLENQYKELCKTVHSAKVDYMSLSIPFEVLNKFDKAKYTTNVDLLRKVCATSNQTMFWLLHGELRRAGHINEDFVRDAIPRTLKRAVGEKD